MKILHVSDLHIVPPGQRLFSLDPLAQFQACIAHINTHHADADLCVLTGDLAHAGAPEAYAALADSLKSLTVPYQLLLGNHDDRAGFLAQFPDTPTDRHGFVQSWLDMHDLRLIFLDTLETGEIHGRLCERRLQWLAEALDGARDRDVLLFTHHPLPDLQYPSMDWIGLRDKMAVLQLLQRHGRVRHLFSGHVHRAASGIWQGMPFSTVPGTNHQHELDLVTPGYATTRLEPPAYAIALFRDGDVVTHFHAFTDASARFPYHPPVHDAAAA